MNTVDTRDPWHARRINIMTWISWLTCFLHLLTHLLHYLGPVTVPMQAVVCFMLSVTALALIQVDAHLTRIKAQVFKLTTGPDRIYSDRGTCKFGALYRVQLLVACIACF
jgi:hypothetical protein